MASQIAKKKKRSINRELFIGGGAIVLMFPIIALAVIGALLGAFVGFALLSFSEVTAITSLTLLLTYAFFTVVFGVILLRISQRVQLLLQRKQDLKAEQKRVATLIDTSSVINRLKEHDLSTDSDQNNSKSDNYFYDESIG